MWDNPWVVEDEPEAAMMRLRRVVEKKLGGRVVLEDGRYLAAEFKSRGPLGGEVVDDAEWYLAPNDVLVQFRAARRGNAPTDFGANRERMEQARIALGWPKVEVLRNRRRALVVVESPFDSFGPATYDRDEYGFTNRDLVPVNADVPAPPNFNACTTFRSQTPSEISRTPALGPRKFEIERILSRKQSRSAGDRKLWDGSMGTQAIASSQDREGGTQPDFFTLGGARLCRPVISPVCLRPATRYRRSHFPVAAALSHLLVHHPTTLRPSAALISLRLPQRKAFCPRSLRLRHLSTSGVTPFPPSPAGRGEPARDVW